MYACTHTYRSIVCPQSSSQEAGQILSPPISVLVYIQPPHGLQTLHHVSDLISHTPHLTLQPLRRSCRSCNTARVHLPHGLIVTHLSPCDTLTRYLHDSAAPGFDLDSTFAVYHCKDQISLCGSLMVEREADCLFKNTVEGLPWWSSG